MWSQFASLVSDLTVTKGNHSDVFVLARRSRAMSLSAETIWSLLPPLTVTAPEVSIAGIVEPANDVGDYAFDYAINGDRTHPAIVDAIGHDTHAAVMAVMAISAYRHNRRQAVGLAQLWEVMNASVRAHLGDERFVTALMAELDNVTGRLTWCNAGHPAPLLIRDGRRASQLLSQPTAPLGLDGGVPEVAEEDLQPGDRLLFFTDGVVDARHRRRPFGSERLIDLVLRETAAGRSLSETVRPVSHAWSQHHEGDIPDDGTLLMCEWTGTSSSSVDNREVEAVSSGRR